MDKLTPFFSRFSLTARVFFAGHLCGTSPEHASGATGHLHVLKSGVLTVFDSGGKPTIIREPSVLLFLRPEEHTFQTEGADLVCAFVEFGAGMLTPLASALPGFLAIPLSSIVELKPTIELLFMEAFGQREGRQAAVDRLAEYFLILLIRSALKLDLIHAGVLKALTDNRLAGAVTAMHAEPERAWSLAELSRIAGMSRARFAACFLATMGQTAFSYLAILRIGFAQSLLRKGEPLKMVAPSVGYGSTGALIRSFSQHVGMPPMTWLAAQQSSEPG